MLPQQTCMAEARCAEGTYLQGPLMPCSLCLQLLLCSCYSAACAAAAADVKSRASMAPAGTCPAA